MSGKDAVDNFLSRWSRRKIEARGAEEEAKPAGPSEACAPAVPPSGAGDAAMAPIATGAPLPPIEELRGLESEYRDFLRPEVDASLRRTALKKLFQDPHFNIMDGLDTYIDDYTNADPIPEAMLRGLNQAQGLLFDREDEQGTGEEQPAAVDGANRPPPVIDEVTEEVTDEVTKLSSPDTTGKDDGNRPQPGPNAPSATT